MNSYRIYTTARRLSRNVQDSFSNRQKLERLHNIVMIKRIDHQRSHSPLKKKRWPTAAHTFSLHVVTLKLTNLTGRTCLKA